MYGLLFVNLLITSLLVHGVYITQWWMNAVDKFAIALVVLYGLRVLMKKIQSIHILILSCAVFTFVQVIYLYSRILKIRDTDLELANMYHMYMHFIVSMGHSLLILL